LVGILFLSGTRGALSVEDFLRPSQDIQDFFVDVLERVVGAEGSSSGVLILAEQEAEEVDEAEGSVITVRIGVEGDEGKTGRVCRAL
jgi:hypothetical protein